MVPDQPQTLSTPNAALLTASSPQQLPFTTEAAFASRSTVPACEVCRVLPDYRRKWLLIRCAGFQTDPTRVIHGRGPRAEDRPEIDIHPRRKPATH